MPEALRLQFEWRDGTIHLKSARPVKRAPAGNAKRDERATPTIGISSNCATITHGLSPPGRDVVADSEVQTGDLARPSRGIRARSYTVEIIAGHAEARRLVVTERRMERRGVRRAARDIVHVEARKIGGDDTPRQEAMDGLPWDLADRL
jgi:hypothetical protein